MWHTTCCNSRIAHNVKVSCSVKTAEENDSWSELVFTNIDDIGFTQQKAK
jgi:hypothetical protein